MLQSTDRVFKKRLDSMKGLYKAYFKTKLTPRVEMVYNTSNKFRWIISTIDRPVVAADSMHKLEEKIMLEGEHHSLVYQNFDEVRETLKRC